MTIDGKIITLDKRMFHKINLHPNYKIIYSIMYLKV